MTPRNATIRRILIAACCALAAGCAALYPQSFGFSVDELQSKLAQRMPIKRTFYNVFDVELSKPRLTLDPHDTRIATLFDAVIKIPLSDRTFTGAIKLSGIPWYESDTRSIMLGSSRVDALEIVGLSPNLTKRLQELANGIAPAVFDRQPLHTFKPEELRFGGMQLNPGAIRITGNRLIVELAPK